MQTSSTLDKATAAVHAGNRKKALKLLAEARQRQPDPQDRKRMALLYQELKKVGLARGLLNKLIDEEPRDPQLRLDLALFAADAGDRKTALKALAAARQRHPDCDDRRRMASLYQRLQEYGQAQSLIDELILESPLDPGLRLERATLSAQAVEHSIALLIDRAARAVKDGKRQAALKFLAEARTKNPGPTDRHRMALLYQEMKDYASALALLAPLAREKTADASLLADFGLCKFLAGRADDAIADLLEAIKRDPAWLPAYLTLGWIYDGQKRFDEELRLYNSAPADGGDLALRSLLAQSREAARLKTRPVKKAGAQAFFLMALIPLLAALGAAQGVPHPEAETDGLLVGAESLLHELEGGPQGCEREFSVERMIAGFKQMGIPPQAAPYLTEGQSGMGDISMYSICKSYSLKTPSACDALEVFRGKFDYHSSWVHGPITMIEDCRTTYYEVQMVKAKIKGEPGVQELCAQQDKVSRKGDRNFKPEFTTQACKVMHESSGTAKEICRRLEPFLEDSSRSVLCEDNLLFMNADAEVCRRLSQFSQAKCQGYAAFKKAAPTGNPALCGDLPICRVMMEQADACQPFAEKIKRGFCGLLRKAAYVNARKELLTVFLNKASHGKKLDDLKMRALRQKNLGP